MNNHCKYGYVSIAAAPEVALACGEVARRMGQGSAPAHLLDQVEAALAVVTD